MTSVPSQAKKSLKIGTSLVGQWLRFHPPNAGGAGSSPDQETRSYTTQLRVRTLKLKILQATTKKKKKILCAIIKTQCKKRKKDPMQQNKLKKKI